VEMLKEMLKGGVGDLEGSTDIYNNVSIYYQIHWFFYNARSSTIELSCVST